MSFKKRLRWFVAVGLLGLLLAIPKPALALSACGGSYVAEAGETLQSIASRCGTSIDAIRQANPGLGDSISAGQTLWLPGAYQGPSNNYAGQPDSSYYGSPYGGNSYGNQYNGNPYGSQYSGNCYAYQGGSNYYGGQYGANCYRSQYGGNTYASYGMPSGGTYVVQQGDTMRMIADRLGIALSALVAANPQIWNPSLIYPGQGIFLPTYNAQPSYYNPQRGYYPWDHRDGPRHFQEISTTLYTIQHGDTLKSIAKQFDTTVDSLLELNPTIKKPSRIHAGMIIRIW